MARGSITKTSVSSLPVPRSGRNFLWDSKLRGFGVFVTSSGHRSYILQYRMAGRPPTKRFTIGRHGSPWTPKQARQRAYGLLWQIANGVDPMDAKKAARAKIETDEALRFKAYLATFNREHVQARGLRKTPDSIMRDWILPAFGEKLISEISKKDALDLLAKISLHSKSMANHAFDWLRTMMNFAKSQSVIEVSPLDNLKRPHDLPSRERVLTDREIQIVWQAASDLEFPRGEFIKWLILTGLRSQEVRGARWEEFDLAQRVWVVPPERTKNKKPHLVPLTPTLIGRLDEHWPAESRRGLLFINGDGTQFSTAHLKVRLDEIITEKMRVAAKRAPAENEHMPHFVFHDLRRTLATGLQKLGIPVEHTEALLNHAVGATINVDPGLFRAYHLYRYEPEKRRALTKWHAHITRLMSLLDGWPGGKALP